QKMLRAGSLQLHQAAEVLHRAHLGGGQITVSDTKTGDGNKGIETPVEAILVEAGLITNAMWRTLLGLHGKIRTGQMTKDEAMQEMRALHPRPAETVKKVTVQNQPTVSIPKDVLELIKTAGIVTDLEIEE